MNSPYGFRSAPYKNAKFFIFDYLFIFYFLKRSEGDLFLVLFALLTDKHPLP